MEANISSAQSFLGNGSIAQSRPYIAKDGKPYITVLKRNGNINNPEDYVPQLVGNATLRYDEWRQLDDVVIKVAEQRLNGVQDLIDNGLTRNIGNAMGTTVFTWEEMSDAMEATLSIDPVKRAKGDQVDFATKHIPLPVTHSDYQISERLLQESRNRGSGIDTINAERAARKIAEKQEDMLFGATSLFNYGGGIIYTYLTHPDINTVTMANTWDSSAVTPAGIKTNVLDMIQASINAKYYGPWMLYVPTAYQTVLDDDYDVSGSSTHTIRTRIEMIKGIKGIKVIDRLPANKVLLVCMQSDCVDLIQGTPVQNIQWDSEGGFVHNYKVMTIQVPRVKSDYDNNSGIVLLEA